MTIADRYDAFLFDLDGVLYLGDRPVPGAPEAVARLREAGKGVAFVTNNSSATPEEVAGKLARAGVRAAADEVETSALTTAAILSSRGVASAFVVGERGIREALVAAGIEVRGGEPRSVDVVVIGWDRTADYAKLRIAGVLVERGASLVATNGDASFPAPDGTRWPGAGALLAAIETTTARTAEVMGKPHAPLLLAARARAGGGRPLLIGDRLDTDIAGAVRLGWDSLLVLTGIATLDDLPTAGVAPTYVAEDLSAMFEQQPARRRKDPGGMLRGNRPNDNQHHRTEGPTMLVDDVRKAIEATIGNLTTAKAQDLAKGFLEPGAAKEQVAKTAADLLEWSQHNRERMREFVGREIADQMKRVGVASQKEVDALKKRVRDLERAAGMTASGRKPATKKSPSKKTAAKKSSSARSTSRSTGNPAAATPRTGSSTGAAAG